MEGNMKRKVSYAAKTISLLTAASLLTACGSQAGSTGNGTESPSGNDAAASGEVETVSVLFPTFATTNSDEETEKIEAAVNQYLADKGYALALDIQYTTYGDYMQTVTI
jgi:hypothetical protein